jgi:hypothetical protein
VVEQVRIKFGWGWLIAWFFVLYAVYCVLAFLSGHNPWTG